MVKEYKNSVEIIEQGDIFFFYRPKVDTEEVKDIKDVQRFYMVTSPEEEEEEEEKKNDIYRLFLIGQKQLPEIIEGKSTSEEKNWALNILTTSNPDDIHKELLPAEYTTETRGKRRLAAAAPAGEGKYKIVKHDNHTELAYLLELPEIPGPTQKEFEIKKEASYIISVKNPEVNIPGFATVLEKKPEYPKHIKEKFGDRRWISIEDPQLLNYENTQVLLIGARKKDVEEELGIDIDEENETENTADMFKELKVRKEQVPLKPLIKGKFPDKEEIPMAQEEVKHLSKQEYPGGKGGRRGGKVAATASTSAAAVSKLLSGIEFPKDKNELVDYAKENKTKVKSSDEIIEVIKELPDRKYHNMADIEKALGEIR
jgi:hypothetical protein